jgi:hypothetical protein
MKSTMTLETSAADELLLDWEDESLLAAAIAALLVEYGRYVTRQGGQDGANASQANRRLMARWEQLRG